jgi:CRP/FNR family transcriptional regulator
VISNSTTKQRVLEAFEFLQSCDREHLDSFLQRAATAELERGQIVCHQGHECSHLALLLKGSARIYKLGESGREITLYRIGPGESCILTASCILSHLPFPAVAECEENVEAVVVPSNDIRKWLAVSPPWRDYVFSLIAHRMGDIISLVEEVVFQRMDQRIAQYLLQHANPPQWRIEATHQAIASDLGTSREVVSRILKDFESKALIRASRGAVELLDLSLLRKRTGEN